MTGPKLNEGVLLVDETQVATKATARYLRGSATKARQVLDLIRGLDVRRADEVLQFTDRGAAQEVRKVLASAVANAVHNDNQDADELFVLACFADEGPTLKRFRPRARGRASRIRKRTCHITVIVARMSDARLEVVQARQAKSATAGGRRVGTSAQSRRDRVARSRARAESLRSGEGAGQASADEVLDEDTTVEDATVDVSDDTVDTDTASDDTVDTDTASDDTVDTDTAAADTASDDTAGDDTAADDTAADDTVDADTVAADTVEVQGFADLSDDADEQDSAADAADVPAGAVVAPEDGSIPEGYEIKGNASSKKFHIPGGRYYDITVAELFFDTVESAEAAGYEAPAADATAVEEAHTDADETENN